MFETALVESFLNDCLEVAKAKKSPQIASITFPFKNTDFTTCIPNGFHCYLENPETQEAVLGIGSLVESSFTGPQRFEQAKAFCDEILDNAHFFVEDPTRTLTDLRFFSAFTFFDTTACRFSPFQPANIFLPKVQLVHSKGIYTATLNLFVDPHYTARKIKVIYQESLKNLQSLTVHKAHPQPNVTPTTHKILDTDESFLKNTQTAINNTQAGKYQKIVLARACDLEQKGGAFSPRAILQKLRTTYSNCHIFSFNAGRSSTFLGASPERIFKKSRFEITTEAIAGSRPRGKTENEDKAYAEELLNTPKERLEQNIITQTIQQELQYLGLQPCHTKEPRILKLSGLQHLQTTLSAELTQALHPLNILKALHPTPAVGGMPFQAVKEDIQALEAFDRNLYAGPIGWINQRGDSEFVVGIRSGIVDGTRARLYAGAGIVKESIPTDELAEVELKMRGLLDVIT